MKPMIQYLQILKVYFIFTNFLWYSAFISVFFYLLITQNSILMILYSKYYNLDPETVFFHFMIVHSNIFHRYLSIFIQINCFRYLINAWNCSVFNFLLNIHSFIYFPSILWSSNLSLYQRIQNKDYFITLLTLSYLTFTNFLMRLSPTNQK